MKVSQQHYSVVLTTFLAPKLDSFRNPNLDFYEDLKRGKADPKDFERYVYGNSQNKSHDDRDELEGKVKQEMLQIQRDFTKRMDESPTKKL